MFFPRLWPFLLILLCWFCLISMASESGPYNLLNFHVYGIYWQPLSVSCFKHHLYVDNSTFTCLAQTLTLDFALSISSCLLHVSTEYLTDISSLTCPKPNPRYFPFKSAPVNIASISGNRSFILLLLKPPNFQSPSISHTQPSANPVNSSFKYTFPTTSAATTLAHRLKYFDSFLMDFLASILVHVEVIPNTAARMILFKHTSPPQKLSIPSHLRVKSRVL